MPPSVRSQFGLFYELSHQGKSEWVALARPKGFVRPTDCEGVLRLVLVLVVMASLLSLLSTVVVIIIVVLTLLLFYIVSLKGVSLLPLFQLTLSLWVLFYK